MSLEGKSAEEISALAELADQLANDPKTRKGFLHLSKAANPNAHIPEVDIPAQVNTMLEAGLKRLEAAGDQPEILETIGLDWALTQIRDLLARGAPGYHLYILNRAKSALSLAAGLAA